MLPPLGHFTTDLAPERTRHYAAIVAGSGITPVLSLVATALETEPASRFTVVYGNRRAATVMFADELADLKDRYPQRLHLVHVLSREPRASALLSGRIDGDRLRAILASGLVDASSVDEWFLCGPYGMVVEAQSVLADLGVPQKSVHSELFHVEGEPAPPPRSADEPAAAGATVTLILDGRESTVTMSGDERVLDAALRVRSELPYACRGGVCSTCRARLVEGEVVDGAQLCAGARRDRRRLRPDLPVQPGQRPPRGRLRRLASGPAVRIGWRLGIELSDPSALVPGPKHLRDGIVVRATEGSGGDHTIRPWR